MNPKRVNSASARLPSWKCSTPRDQGNTRQEIVVDLREAYRWVVIPNRVYERAKDVQGELCSQGRHRAAGPVDLLVAATAEEHGMTVLHYDSGFQRIAEITGQRVQWLAEPGSIP
jgi:predicted nucleic acid-binding protein